MQHVFTSHEPQRLYVELGSGDIQVEALPDLTESTVEVTGQGSDEVEVQQRGNEITVIAPRRTGFNFGARDLRVRVTMPELSGLATKVGSADTVARGSLGVVRIQSGSGQVDIDHVTEEAEVRTGSGDISIRSIAGNADLKAGSGEIEVGRCDGQAKLTTGSGNIEIKEATREVALKSGSGDLRVGSAETDALLTTASGDLSVGRFVRGQVTTKNVSGDIRVRIPSGIPVWTDVNSTTGKIRSSLQGAGKPQDGQDYVEVRATTVSGDIYLEQI